jgi:hypothetical protein
VLGGPYMHYKLQIQASRCPAALRVRCPLPSGPDQPTAGAENKKNKKNTATCFIYLIVNFISFKKIVAFLNKGVKTFFSKTKRNVFFPSFFFFLEFLLDLLYCVFGRFLTQKNSYLPGYLHIFLFFSHGV